MKNEAKTTTTKRKKKERKKGLSRNQTETKEDQNPPDIFSFLIYYQHVRLSSFLFLVFSSLLQRGLTT